MTEIVLNILAGLGFFFIGMRLLSTHLKQSAGTRVRVIAARLARHRPFMMLLGAGAGMTTQSTNAVTAAATGLATAQMISIREAFALIACANIGTSLLVFLAAVDFRLEILAAAALCGGLFYLKFDQSPRYRAYVGAFLALVLILFGLDMISAGAVQIRKTPELQAFFASLDGMPVVTFLVGAALVPLLQTAKTVAVVVAVLTQSGAIGPLEAIAAVIGANLTSAANVAFLTAGISPAGRALGLYQGLLKVLGSILAMIALIAVLAFDPAALSGIAPETAPFLVAVAYLLMQVGAYAAALVAEGAITRRLQAMVARWNKDDPAQPRFISRQALADPASATELAFKEHLGIIIELRADLDSVREDGPVATGPRRDGVAIARTLAEFLDTLSERAEEETVRRRTGSIQRLHNLAIDMQTHIRRLAANVARSGSEPVLAMPMHAMVESADMLLEQLASCCTSNDPADKAELAELTADRTPVTERIRLTVMSEDHGAPAAERDLFDSCVTFERIIWLIRRYLILSDEPGSPYRDAKRT